MFRKSKLIVATLGLTALGCSLASAHGGGGGGSHPAGGGASMHLPSYSASAPGVVGRAGNQVFHVPHVVTKTVVARTVGDKGSSVVRLPRGIVARTIGNVSNTVPQIPGRAIAPKIGDAKMPEPQVPGPIGSAPTPTPQPKPGQTNKPYPVGVGGGVVVFGTPDIDDPGAPAVTVPASGDAATRTSAPCNCLTKQYLDDGRVMFRDVCTNEALVAPTASTAAR